MIGFTPLTLTVKLPPTSSPVQPYAAEVAVGEAEHQAIGNGVEGRAAGLFVDVARVGRARIELGQGSTSLRMVKVDDAGEA